MLSSPSAPGGPGPGADPVLRRAALLVTAVVVPVVVVLVVLVNVAGRGSRTAGGPVAVISAAPATPRSDLPPVDVASPPATPAADRACPALMRALPPQPAGEFPRTVRSASPYTAAWSDPPAVLICGASPPPGFVRGAATVLVSGVQWFVDTGTPGTVVWTTVDRTVPVQVRLPAGTDSALPAALSPVIAAALPYAAPVPGG